MLPPRCKSCGELVADDHALCGNCWSTLRFLAAPWCARCGRPFEFDPGDGVLCGTCIKAPPLFARARSALAYDDGSRELILRFKHGGDESLSRLFARWMHAAGSELLEEEVLIVPVPLHPLRRIRRRFNQSALLAGELSRMTGHAHDPLSLCRRRMTRSQGGLGKAARRENVRAAFHVPDACRSGIEGRNILLVDDVWTSGATADACIRALRKSGARSVDLLTLARVF